MLVKMMKITQFIENAQSKLKDFSFGEILEKLKKTMDQEQKKITDKV